MFVPWEAFIGGGALLSKKYAIAPFVIFSKIYQKYQCHFSKFSVVIGLKKFEQTRTSYQHPVQDIKHNVGPDCDEDEAIALVMINPLTEGNIYPLPSWVQHIPLATQSYTPGQHSVSESIIAWNVVSKPY